METQVVGGEFVQVIQCMLCQSDKMQSLRFL